MTEKPRRTSQEEENVRRSSRTVATGGMRTSASGEKRTASTGGTRRTAATGGTRTSANGGQRANTSNGQVRRRRRRRRRRINKKRLAMLVAILVVILAVFIFLISSVAKLISRSLSSGSGKTNAVEATSVSEAASESTADESTTEYVGELPDIDINSWEYLLVNADNPIGEYEPEIAEIDGIEVDTRIVDAMQEFEEAVEAQGLPIYLSSGYRSYDTQTYLFNRKLEQGYSEEEAATIVAPPGTSEHQTGLAADITDEYRETKSEELEDTETYQWMSAHCQEYGFVVRFPKGKQDITGIIYEPWHFRYVGVEAATFMMNNNLCLEEFVELYN